MSNSSPNHHIEVDVASMQIKVWDLGPQKPEVPKPPVGPKGKDGDPEYDIAKIEFREKLEEYDLALRTYRQAKIDYAAWHERFGGPYQITMMSLDAKDALVRDPNRYAFDLPKGVEPGPQHVRNLTREQEIARDLAGLAARDPHFGTRPVGDAA